MKCATQCSVHLLSGYNKTPTIIDIIMKRHFLELVMAREGRKEKAETIKENAYACSTMENQFLIIHKPDVLVEIFAGT